MGTPRKWRFLFGGRVAASDKKTRLWSFWQINKCININTVAVREPQIFGLPIFFSLRSSVHFENGQPAGGTSFPVCLRKSSTFRIISYCQIPSGWVLWMLCTACQSYYTRRASHIYMCAMFFLWEILWKCFPNWMKTYWLCHDDDGDGDDDDDNVKRQEKQRCWWLTAVRLGDGKAFDVGTANTCPLYLPISRYVHVYVWVFESMWGPLVYLCVIACYLYLLPAVCTSVCLGCGAISVVFWICLIWNCSPAICLAFPFYLLIVQIPIRGQTCSLEFDLMSAENKASTLKAHWPHWLINNRAHKLLAQPTSSVRPTAYAMANWLQFNKMHRSEGPRTKDWGPRTLGGKSQTKTKIKYGKNDERMFRKQQNEARRRRDDDGRSSAGMLCTFPAHISSFWRTDCFNSLVLEFSGHCVGLRNLFSICYQLCLTCKVF